MPGMPHLHKKEVQVLAGHDQLVDRKFNLATSHVTSSSGKGGGTGLRMLGLDMPQPHSCFKPAPTVPQLPDPHKMESTDQVHMDFSYEYFDLLTFDSEDCTCGYRLWHLCPQESTSAGTGSEVDHEDTGWNERDQPGPD